MVHRILFYYIICLLSVDSLYGQGARLIFRPAEGLSYTVRYNSSISFTQELMGINYKTDTKILTDLRTKVEKKTNEGFSLECSYSDIEFTLKSVTLDLEMYSGSGDTTNPMNIVMRSLTGKKFRRIVSDRSETMEIINLDESIREELNKVRLPSEQKEEFSRYFLQSFGEAAVTEMFRQDAAFYNDSLVYPGHQWYRTMTISSYGIPMHLILNIKVQDLKEGHAMLLAEGILAATSTGNPDGTSYRLEGTQMSEIRMNLLTGLIEKNLTTQFINGTIIVPSPDSSANVEMPLNIRSRMNREIVK